jgi:Fungal specific transcription factor domain
MNLRPAFCECFESRFQAAKPCCGNIGLSIRSSKTREGQLQTFSRDLLLEPLWCIGHHRAKGVGTAEHAKSKYALLVDTDLIDTADAEQCSQELPACSQCLRTGIACRGYRNQVDLMFCDQTNSTVGKVQAREEKNENLRRKRAASRSRGSSKATSKSRKVEILQPEVVEEADPTLIWELVPHPRQSLTPPPEDRATCYFFSNFVLDESGVSRGHMAYLPRIYQQDSLNGALSAVISSVGLAALSNVSNDPTLMGKARQKHVSALSLTNAALRDPAIAKEDGTLAAVTLLGMFENITYRDFGNMKSWSNHVNGAAALVQLRGRQQLNTGVGRALFLQTRHSLV